MKNQYCPISFISYSDVSIFWLADISSIILFPIYLRYHPDGLGGSVNQRTKNFSCQHLRIAKYDLTLNLNLKHHPT